MSALKERSAKAQNFTQDPLVYRAAPVFKESFQGVYKILNKYKIENVVDIGCASGDFLYYLPDSMRGVGIDASKTLVSLAKKRVKRKNVRFLKADALKLTKATARSYTASRTAVSLLGILHTFLDFRPLINAACKFNPDLIIIHSPFSEEPVDSYHYHKLSSDTKAKYQCGYSFFSKLTVEKYLKTKGVRRYQFIPFEMSRRLIRDPGNPLRNYHIEDKSGQRFLTNGIKLLFKEYFLVIEF